jgi:uncharacterized metal-binding protein YceD (DUF177 family)
MKNKPPFKNPPAPELSRPLLIDKIPNGGVAEHLVARPDERQALCERFDLLKLPKLEAKLNIDRVQAGKMIAVTGTLDADVVQACVVTLEPVAAHIQVEIKALFAQADFLETGAGSAMHDDIDEEEAPEPILNKAIDLGEVVSQNLGISLDPYPRSPSAVLPEAYASKDEPSPSVNPFALLKKEIKKKTKEK